MEKNLVKSSIGVTIVMALGYLLSFAKESIIANYYGVSLEVDAYTIAITIPVTLFAMVSVSIQSIVIPLYSHSLINDGDEIANYNLSNFLTIVFIISFVFILFCEIFASGIVYLFAPGFSIESHELATMLLRITAPTILLSVLERVLVGVLNVQGQYTLPTMAICFLNFGLISSIVLLHAFYGIIAACIGQVVGTAMSFLYIVWTTKRFFHYDVVCSFKSPFIIKALKQAIPIIWSVSLGEISAMINRMVASFLFVGSISALGYASKLNSIMLQFFTVAISTIIYPLYAESSARNDMPQLNNRVNLTFSIYSYFLVPLMVGVFCYKQDLVKVAFGRGEFDQNAIDITQSILGFYAVGLLFMALRETITKVFYSLQDTKTPANNSSMAICTTIILNLTLPYFFGVNGLALATAIVSIIFSLRLMCKLCKMHNAISLSEYFKNMIRIVISALCMGVCLYIQNLLYPISNSFISLIVGAIEGVILYVTFNFSIKTPIQAFCLTYCSRK